MILQLKISLPLLLFPIFHAFLSCTLKTEVVLTSKHLVAIAILLPSPKLEPLFIFLVEINSAG